MVHEEGVLTQKSQMLWAPFCRFAVYSIILKVLRRYAVRTLLKSCLTPYFPNLFDYVMLSWFFWRGSNCQGTDTSFNITSPETSLFEKYYVVFNVS
jgi:hypothetical protein